ncbi:DUF6099 family protein [Actinacidiphila yeochonensis]|uniref:DUF6099 family protein n=1 Tax=Actinacidiphila yeochonensis TaxID=89050 RepID=UPI00068E3127|nr:DUF6099 family protein [Actinacidiphila yeochonensis]
MDATRLVAQAERVLGGDPQPEEVIAEAWHAYELTEAVVRMVRGRQAPYLRESVAGARGVRGEDSVSIPGQPAGRVGGVPPSLAELLPPAETFGGGRTAVLTGAGASRVAQLTTVRHPERALAALDALLVGIGRALIGLIGTAADEQAYWQCVEALDAVEEANDQLRSLGRGGPG